MRLVYLVPCVMIYISYSSSYVFLSLHSYSMNHNPFIFMMFCALWTLNLILASHDSRTRQMQCWE